MVRNDSDKIDRGYVTEIFSKLCCGVYILF